MHSLGAFLAIPQSGEGSLAQRRVATMVDLEQP